jgi:hypothetical protein
MHSAAIQTLLRVVRLPLLLSANLIVFSNPVTLSLADSTFLIHLVTPVSEPFPFLSSFDCFPFEL